MLLNDVKDIHSQLHRVHLLHELLHVARVLTNKRHQILVGHDVLQVLGILRFFRVDLLEQSIESETTDKLLS